MTVMKGFSLTCSNGLTTRRPERAGRNLAVVGVESCGPGSALGRPVDPTTFSSCGLLLPPDLAEGDAIRTVLAALLDDDRIRSFDAYRARVLELPRAIEVASPARREELCKIVSNGSW